MSVAQCLTLMTLAFVNILTLTSGQGCVNVPLPHLIVLNETDLEGTEVLRFDSDPVTQWTYRLDLPEEKFMGSYFNMSWDDDTQQIVFTLTRTLDIEEIKRSWKACVNVVLLNLYCQADPEVDIIVRYAVPIIVTAVNEFPPKFNTSRINIEVNEILPVGQHLLYLIDWSHDDDLNLSDREIESFSLSPNEADFPGNANDWIHINSYLGVLSLKKSLDYEALPAYDKTLTSTIIVKDTGGMTGSTVLTITVLDEDDLPPSFNVPGCLPPCSVTYRATVSPDALGVISNITHGPIHATDGDAFNYEIAYEIILGTDNINHFFQINSSSAKVGIVKELKHTGLKAIVLIIEASEVSMLKRSARASLLITVESPENQILHDHLLLIVAIVAACLLCVVIAMITCFSSNCMLRSRHVRR